jgi:hypothetical protein
VATSTATGPATASQKLADWVGAVILGDYVRACTEMEDRAVSPPRPYTVAQCRCGVNGIWSDQSLMEGRRPLPEWLSPEPPIGTDGSMVVSSDKITIDGQPFEPAYESKSSDGAYVYHAPAPYVFVVAKIDGAWYVVLVQRRAP